VTNRRLTAILAVMWSASAMMEKDEEGTLARLNT
jgi:hypothetical protein